MIFGVAFSITMSRENCVCQEERKSCGFRGLRASSRPGLNKAFNLCSTHFTRQISIVYMCLGKVAQPVFVLNPSGFFFCFYSAHKCPLKSGSHRSSGYPFCYNYRLCEETADSSFRGVPVSWFLSLFSTWDTLAGKGVPMPSSFGCLCSVLPSCCLQRLGGLQVSQSRPRVCLNHLQAAIHGVVVWAQQLRWDGLMDLFLFPAAQSVLGDPSSP